jgi:hypothetical protein
VCLVLTVADHCTNAEEPVQPLLVIHIHDLGERVGVELKSVSLHLTAQVITQQAETLNLIQFLYNEEAGRRTYTYAHHAHIHMHIFTSICAEVRSGHDQKRRQSEKPKTEKYPTKRLLIFFTNCTCVLFTL